ncbi:MAG: hypothetical protein ACRDRI_09835 [Pseudonocardiaceae bacterium]
MTPLFVDLRRDPVESLDVLLTVWRISLKGEVAVVVGPGQGELIFGAIGPALAGASPGSGVSMHERDGEGLKPTRYPELADPDPVSRGERPSAQVGKYAG